MNTPAQRLLTEFVLEKSTEEPLRRRLLLYRALAAGLPEASEDFRKLMTLADELESIEARHQQLLLDLRQSTSNA